MKRIALLPCLLLLSGMLVCTAADLSWIDEPYKKYSHDDFFASVGESDSKEEAELKAVESLASIFGQDVESESEAESKMRQASIAELGTSYESSKTLNQKIQRFVNQDDLIGIEIAESYYDKKRKRYYALAVMDKNVAFSIYETILRNNDKKARSFLKLVEEDNYSLLSYSNILKAKNLSKINENYYSRVTVLNPNKAEKLKNSLLKTSELTPKILEIASKTKIAVNIENDPSNEIKLAFSKVLSDLGFIVTKEKARYVLSGNAFFEEREIKGKEIVNIDYKIQTVIKDTSNTDEMVSWNVSGKEGSKTAEYAKQKAIASLIKKITNDYPQYFNETIGGIND